MMSVKKWRDIQQFFSFWYFRYLLCTELYVVEPWERTIMNILLLILVPALMHGSLKLVRFLGSTLM